VSDPLLLTKLYMPAPHPNVFPRQELTQRLLAALEGRIVVVTAPPGFGKTTLLGETLRASGRVATWLSLDDGDNELAAFCRYLGAALDQVEEAAGAAATALLRSPVTPPARALVTALINGVTTLDSPFGLVLDDFHVIEDTTVLEAVELLLERQPPQMHLVIAGRRDPLLPIARSRGRGWVTELRAADLRFAPSEAELCLNQTMGLGLEAIEIETLTSRTEGWAAGLHLAGMSLKAYATPADRSRFVRVFAGDDRHIMDYLIGEVLSQQTDDVTQFLSQTAILDRFSASLCNAVGLRDGGPRRAGTADAGHSGCRQPLPHPARQPATVVSLSPPVRRAALPSAESPTAGAHAGAPP
jgi:LuxR family maltose regulon positive regulatory protein